MDTPLQCNMGAVKLTRNLVFHTRSKHIKIQHHFVREKVLEGKIKVSYIPTKDQHKVHFNSSHTDILFLDVIDKYPRCVKCFSEAHRSSMCTYMPCLEILVNNRREIMGDRSEREGARYERSNPREQEYNSHQSSRMEEER